jgi:hypothetical protein
MKTETPNFDLSLDHDFENKTDIPWLPWVGCNYVSSPSKLLIIGESTYNWDPKDIKVQDRIARKDHLRVLHTNHALNFDRNSNYVRNIERAIFGTKNPDKKMKSKLWNSVIYHNLVLRPMSTIKERPNYADYFLGWEELIKLIEVSKSSECIVYGLQWEKTKSLRAVLNSRNIAFSYSVIPDSVNRSKPKLIEFDLAGSPIKILFNRHPSAFFSWKKWHPILLKHIDGINKYFRLGT